METIQDIISLNKGIKNNEMILLMLNEFKLTYAISNKELKAHLSLLDENIVIHKCIMSNTFKSKLIASLIDFEADSIVEAISYIRGTIVAGIAAYNQENEELLDISEEEVDDYIYEGLGKSPLIALSKESLFNCFPLVNKDEYTEVLKRSM